MVCVSCYYNIMFGEKQLMLRQDRKKQNKKKNIMNIANEIGSKMFVQCLVAYLFVWLLSTLGGHIFIHRFCFVVSKRISECLKIIYQCIHYGTQETFVRTNATHHLITNGNFQNALDKTMCVIEAPALNIDVICDSIQLMPENVLKKKKKNNIEQFIQS